jgi:hypothetical protein
VTSNEVFALQQNLLASFQHNTCVPVPGKKKINHPTFSTRDIDSLWDTPASTNSSWYFRQQLNFGFRVSGTL